MRHSRVIELFVLHCLCSSVAVCFVAYFSSDNTSQCILCFNGYWHWYL